MFGAGEKAFTLLILLVLIQFFHIFEHLPEEAYRLPQKYPWVGLYSAWAEQNPSQKDIQWFKDEMRISPKYIEEHEGILGMSWLIFLVMVLLIIFSLGALIAMYLHHKRTKQILTSLLQEEKSESKNRVQKIE